MNKILGAVITLIVSVVAGIVIYDYQKEEPELRFTLSDSIPTSFFTSGKTANIQQLEVVNVGNKHAEKIIIKVNGKIQHFQLNKHSSSDVEKTFENSNGIEIVYPELPPEGKISIVLSSDSPLNDSSLHIAYRNGQAIKAFGQDGGPSLAEFILFWSPFGFYLLLILWQSFSMYIDWYCKQYRDLQKNKKPWFITTEKWIELREKAVEEYFNYESIYDVSSAERSKVYLALNSGKFEFLSENEWNNLSNAAVKEFSSILELLIMKSGLSVWQLERLYKLDKPENYSSTKWSEFKDKLDGQYVDALISEASQSFLNTMNLREKTSIQTSLVSSERDRRRLVSSLSDLYAARLARDLLVEYNSVSFLDSHDLKGVEEHAKNRLQNLAYRLQLSSKFGVYFSNDKAKKFLQEEKEEWVKDSDHKLMVEHANSIVEASSKSTKYNKMLGLFDAILYKITFPSSKPEELSEREWKEIQTIEDRIVKDLSDNEKILAEIHEKELIIPHLKDKLDKQLRLINEVLNDPTAIDRIEEYDETFAKGNFDNLRKVSEILSGK